MAEENQSTNSSQEQPVESTPTPTPTLPLPRTYGELLGRNQNTASKREWPEVVGLTAEEAEKKIKEDKPGVHVHVVPSNCFITMDFRQDRVRVFVDHSRKVERPPRIG